MITLSDFRKATEGMSGDTVIAIDIQGERAGIVLLRQVSHIGQVPVLPGPRMLYFSQSDVEDLIDAIATPPKHE